MISPGSGILFTAGARVRDRLLLRPRNRPSSKRYTLFVETESIVARRLRDSKTISVVSNDAVVHKEADPRRTFFSRDKALHKGWSLGTSLFAGDGWGYFASFLVSDLASEGVFVAAFGLCVAISKGTAGNEP